MITSKVNGITKHSFGGGNHVYYFATCIVNVSGDEIQYLYFNNESPFRFTFSSLDEKYSTSDAEGFVDYLANNDYFVIATSGGGGGGGNVTVVGNTTDFSTATKQDEQTVLLTSIDGKDFSTSANQVLTNIAADNLIGCMSQLIHLNTKILHYIKAIAE